MGRAVKLKVVMELLVGCKLELSCGKGGVGGGGVGGGCDMTKSRGGTGNC